MVIKLSPGIKYWGMEYRDQIYLLTKYHDTELTRRPSF